MQALISLIAATGLRVGEALALDRGDAGPDTTGTLTVTGKNDQMRLVPLHPTTAAMLAGYAARRDRLCPHPASPAFFVTSTGQRAAQRGVAETFARLVTLAGIAAPPGRRRPRVHDLRHTFAVTTLTRWYRDGADVQAQAAGAVGLPGAFLPGGDVLVPAGHPRAARAGRRAAAAARPAGRHRREDAMTALAPILEAFFTDRLMTQRGASPHTIASYRDTFTLLLGHIHQQTGKLPAQLDLADLDAPRSARSCSNWKQPAATAPPPATRGWRPSARCSATPACAPPSTRP